MPGARRHARVEEVLVYANGDLDALDPEVLQEIVDATALMISLDAWGLKAFDGHLNLAAHFGSKAKSATSASPSGAVTSRSIGALSISYGTAAAPAASDGDLSSTSYGQLYLMLKRTLLVPPMAIGGLCA